MSEPFFNSDDLVPCITVRSTPDCCFLGYDAASLNTKVQPLLDENEHLKSELAKLKLLEKFPAWTIEKNPKGKYICMIKGKELIVQISSKLFVAISEALERVKKEE